MSFENYMPMANKLLQPDGSITTFDGTIIEPPNAERATDYASRMPKAAKFINQDDKITNILPVSGEQGGQNGQGEKGENGLSAYELALENGFKGSEIEWLESLQGKQGIPGKDGSDVGIATEDTLGTVQIGEGLEIDEHGLLSVESSIINQLTGLLFLTRENNIPTLVEDKPTSSIVILPTTWIGADPDVWFNLTEIVHGDKLSDVYFEFVPGNAFNAKFWFVSDVARNDVQIQLQVINAETDAVLAMATTVINLNATGIPIPVTLNGTIQALEVLPLSKVKSVIRMMTPQFGLQVGIVSNVPDELSYVNTTASGGNGNSGADGKSPFIGDNGNWFQWGDVTQDFIDTGIAAQGGLSKQAFTISTWRMSSEFVGYSYETDITVLGVTPNTLTQIIFDVKHANAVDRAVIMGMSKELDGTVRLYAMREPEVELTGHCIVFGGD